MCLNKKVLVGLGIVAVGLVVLRPGWAVAALPFLILAICPLSMIFMMHGMRGRIGEAAGSRQGAQPESSGVSTAMKADLGHQIADPHSQARFLDIGNSQHDSGPGLGTREHEK
jgi:DUF2933 family protein